MSSTTARYTHHHHSNSTSSTNTNNSTNSTNSYIDFDSSPTSCSGMPNHGDGKSSPNNNNNNNNTPTVNININIQDDHDGIESPSANSPTYSSISIPIPPSLSRMVSSHHSIEEKSMNQMMVRDDGSEIDVDIVSDIGNWCNAVGREGGMVGRKGMLRTPPYGRVRRGEDYDDGDYEEGEEEEEEEEDYYEAEEESEEEKEMMGLRKVTSSTPSKVTVEQQQQQHHHHHHPSLISRPKAPSHSKSDSWISYSPDRVEMIPKEREQQQQRKEVAVNGNGNGDGDDSPTAWIPTTTTTTGVGSGSGSRSKSFDELKHLGVKSASDNSNHNRFSNCFDDFHTSNNDHDYDVPSFTKPSMITLPPPPSRSFSSGAALPSSYFSSSRVGVAANNDGNGNGNGNENGTVFQRRGRRVAPTAVGMNKNIPAIDLIIPTPTTATSSKMVTALSLNNNGNDDGDHCGRKTRLMTSTTPTTTAAATTTTETKRLPRPSHSHSRSRSVSSSHEAKDRFHGLQAVKGKDDDVYGKLGVKGGLGVGVISISREDSKRQEEKKEETMIDLSSLDSLDQEKVFSVSLPSTTAAGGSKPSSSSKSKSTNTTNHHQSKSKSNTSTTTISKKPTSKSNKKPSSKQQHPTLPPPPTSKTHPHLSPSSLLQAQITYLKLVKAIDPSVLGCGEAVDGVLGGSAGGNGGIGGGKRPKVQKGVTATVSNGGRNESIANGDARGAAGEADQLLGRRKMTSSVYGIANEKQLEMIERGVWEDMKNMNVRGSGIMEEDGSRDGEARRSIEVELGLGNTFVNLDFGESPKKGERMGVEFPGRNDNDDQQQHRHHQLSHRRHRHQHSTSTSSSSSLSSFVSISNSDLLDAHTTSSRNTSHSRSSTPPPTRPSSRLKDRCPIPQPLDLSQLSNKPGYNDLDRSRKAKRNGMGVGVVGQQRQRTVSAPATPSPSPEERRREEKERVRERERTATATVVSPEPATATITGTGNGNGNNTTLRRKISNATMTILSPRRAAYSGSVTSPIRADSQGGGWMMMDEGIDEYGMKTPAGVGRRTGGGGRDGQRTIRNQHQNQNQNQNQSNHTHNHHQGGLATTTGGKKSFIKGMLKSGARSFMGLDAKFKEGERMMAAGGGGHGSGKMGFM